MTNTIDRVDAMETVSDERLREIADSSAKVDATSKFVGVDPTLLISIISELLASRLAKQGWQGMESAPRDETIIEVRRIAEPERWNAARFHRLKPIDLYEWRPAESPPVGGDQP